MRIVVCAKEVLDPDAVNNYALAGRLEIGDDGKSLTQTTIPRLMNGFDEQALEAALRLRDAGAECRIGVVSVGSDSTALLKHAAALGADEITAVPMDDPAPDYHVVASLLAAWIRCSGNADLVLCGRQASDDDQGVVPALIGETLGMPLVTNARAVERVEGDAFRITRVTPDGDEVVEVPAPAVVTVSNELGEPRYPTAAKKIAARRMKPEVAEPTGLGLSDQDLQPRVLARRQFVPTVQGNCEFLAGETAAELADALVARLRQDGLIP
ncbi:MAG: electron transfer flavoprotein subunit beta/FixA family protein [Deltaproteobacteria bacterium]|nr:electron transfer flavoprotein subunit beta/FixA family protein [Deltaproteobacteria bacterium]MBW2372550.1 electron transfer flavoprotein subunit beta/FixA family protein [Deltaproteobacteria bacterium]